MKLSEEQIEKLRRSGLRLDRHGRFFHEGGEVTHEGMRRAFLRWVDRLPDGRAILRLDANRFVYLDLDADATPLLVTTLRVDGDRLVAHCNDGSSAPLDLAGLVLDGENGGARCRVRGGLEARLLSPAYYVLAGLIESTEPGAAHLRVGDRIVRVPVASAGRTASS